MCKMQRLNTAQRPGQALVEFALFIPILILLIAGAVDLGSGFQTWISLTNAAREGARLGAATSDAAKICARVNDELANDNITIPCGNVTLSYPTISDGATDCTGVRAKRCPVRVQVTYVQTTLLGSILGFNAINISAFNDTIVITE